MDVTVLNTTSVDSGALNNATMSHDGSVDALLSTMTTGIAIVDALVCMVLSLLVQRFLAAVQGAEEASFFSKIYDWLFPPQDKHLVSRVIEITQRFNAYGNKIWDYEQKNHLLQKAITLYLTDIIDLRNKDASYDLITKPKTKKLGQVVATKLLDDDSCDGDTSVSSYGSGECDDDDAYYGEVDGLNVEVMPPHNTWIYLGNGIRFMHEQEAAPATDSKTPTEAKIRFIFTSAAVDGSERIDALIQTAYKKYQDDERKKYAQDTARYFYIQSDTKGGSESEASTVAYKRYALGEDKTFDNLFFEEKETVLQLLDNFTNKAGKFAIKGFPYKLGLLLHGPPGTGKTSLIKAVAQHTKRHIVTISLGKIKTNQELLDALFDMKFAVQGLDTPVQMGFEDVVFVMEDIDCASSIVNARQPTDDLEDAVKEKQADASSDAIPQSNKEIEADDKDKLMSAMVKAVVEDEKKHAARNDHLNLSGLLNVLDGVIDCPGRIVIMTTNHPEKLDPALVRPGRVNKKLLLSYMGASHIQQMIEYYCLTKLTGDQSERLTSTFAHTDKHFTPAEIEELCAEFDDVESILDGLKALTSAV